MDPNDLQTAAAIFGMTGSDAVPVLSRLLGAPTEEAVDVLPDLARRQTLAALSAWFPAVAQALPTLVVVEDLQWADPSTLEFLGMLVDEASRSRLLIVATSRPEFRTSWLGRSHVAAIALDRLSPAEVAALVDAQAGAPLSDADRTAVVARSDGVPLFAEELVLAVRAGDTAELPEALEDVLVARLERLGEARDLALMAAVLGREFSYGDVGRLSDWSTEALDKALDVLVEQEVLHQRGQPPYAEYVFRHALVRDAAYATLLSTDRRALHARAAAVLGAAAPPDVLAHHLTHSGAGDEAVDAWLAAADAALEVSAFAEAHEHARAALAALDLLPADDARRDRAVELLASAAA
jgi:predicted ATPase